MKTKAWHIPGSHKYNFIKDAVEHTDFVITPLKELIISIDLFNNNNNIFQLYFIVKTYG